MAGIYSDTDFSKATFYPHCPAYVLPVDYRKQLYIKELIGKQRNCYIHKSIKLYNIFSTGFNADIICLQELDKKVFHRDLQPKFDLLGYDCFFREKRENTGEGCSILINRKKLE